MEIKIGSRVFFEQYNDFKPHDNDYVVFKNNPAIYDTFAHIVTRDKDIFAYKEMTKEEFIKYELEHCKNASMAVAKLLVPELCEYMNITIDDLKLFKFASENIKPKHSYIKTIYDFYIENNGFYLTDHQRDIAYQDYKKYRL